MCTAMIRKVFEMAKFRGKKKPRRKPGRAE
nr:MAG TPA: hypothetical protein [Caudoviricetes sp.]